MTTVSKAPTDAGVDRSRRTLRLLDDLDTARAAHTQVLLRGIGVNDVFVDEAGRALWLRDLMRSYCASRGLALVTYRVGEGPVAHPTLPEGQNVSVRSADAGAHPTQVVDQIVEDLRRANRPAVFLFDHADTTQSGDDAARPLDLALLTENLQALTSDVRGWQQPGLQLVLVDRGGGIGRLSGQPGVRVLQLGPPDAAESELFLRRKLDAAGSAPMHLAQDLPVAEAARLSGGLLLRHLRELSDESTAARPVGRERIVQLKGSVLRDQSNGTLSLIGEAASFERDFAGMHGPRLHLQNMRDVGQSTVRLVLCGPPGTGKTRVAQAFATSLGVPLISFAKIAGSLMGQTEDNMRLALDIVAALAPVVLFMDEIDQGVLAARNSDGQTSNEAYMAVRAMLFEFLGDPEDDNGISVIGTTNVATRLDAAAESRFGFLPVLFASGPELSEIICIHARRQGMTLSGDVTALFTELCDAGLVLSGRSAQRVLRRAALLATRARRTTVDVGHLRQAVEQRVRNDWKPSSEYSTLTSLVFPDDTEALPWEAARVLGEDYPMPAYLRPYLAADGRLDVAHVDRRILELEGTPGVYR